MSRWRQPFRTQEAAEKFLKQAEKESGRKCFVKKITFQTHVFKIFSSDSDYEVYKKKKTDRETEGGIGTHMTDKSRYYLTSNWFKMVRRPWLTDKNYTLNEIRQSDEIFDARAWKDGFNFEAFKMKWDNWFQDIDKNGEIDLFKWEHGLIAGHAALCFWTWKKNGWPIEELWNALEKRYKELEKHNQIPFADTQGLK